MLPQRLMLQQCKQLRLHTLSSNKGGNNGKKVYLSTNASKPGSKPKMLKHPIVSDQREKWVGTVIVNGRGTEMGPSASSGR